MPRFNISPDIISQLKPFKSTLRRNMVGILLLSTLFLSCQQLILNKVSDYSSLLPSQQLIYLSLSTQPQALAAGFPYQKLLARLLSNKRLQNLVSKRLLRSQLAIGIQGQIYAINQIIFDNQLFQKLMTKQNDWSVLSQLETAYLRNDELLALQMPERNLLYLSQLNPSFSQQLAQQQIQTQQDFAQQWGSGAKHTELPQKFRQLQQEQPLVAYSPQIINLIVNPLLQKSFPRTLGPFAKVSSQFPVSQMLVWIEVTPKTAGGTNPSLARYMLHLELATGSLLLSKGLESGFRLFLPSLLLRSKQEFIRHQLPNVRLDSTQETLHLQIPLDQDSLENIFDQLIL